ncbi:MAG: ATP-binding protein, partial [Actinomycetota bacterium]|nr:ATP-binding protein [Actinomycetota bacterium]
VPAGYITISSGLGQSSPLNLIILPIIFQDEVLGVIEAGSFAPFTELHQDFLSQLVEMIGVNVNTIIANARTDALLAESQRLAAELQARSTELQARQDELQRSNADLEDKAVQLVRQNHDIELKNKQIEQARREIEERARQLDLASQYKSQFLANMSHELRTPLNSLLVLARLLAQNPEQNLTPRQVEYANVIHSSGSDVLQLINDVLDLSKVEAGKMDIHPESFALSALVDDLEAVFLPLTAEKGLDFAIRADAGVPADLFTDKQRLRQILHNLLSNAVKFTEQGQVEVAIAVPRRPPTGQRDLIEFSVIDTGIGIAEENLSAIFGAFQQADGTTSRRYGGTGLGLAICREVAALLGGQVSVTSEVGVGSTFTLVLPASWPGAPESATALNGVQVTGAAAGRLGAPDGAGQPAGLPDLAGTVQPVDAPRSHDSLKGKRVLVVDDDPRSVFALTGVLELYGLSVVHAPDGRSGIETLRQGGFDLVLMDVMMPQLDGHSTTQAIRQMPEFADLPVIAVTARAMQGDKEKSIAAGASDYVTKPVDTEELLACMERWLAPRP